MSEVKWIKITTDIFNDEKMLLIESMPDSDSIIVIWFKLLSLAGKSNNGGLVMMSDKVPYTKDMLPILFRRKATVVELALLTFVKFGMIEILDNNTILISNWGKHQNIDQLEKLRIGQRQRQKEYRERQKEKVMLPLHNSNALESSISISKSSSKSSIKKTKYLDFVLLTEEEHIKLKDKFNSRVDNLIENLNNYIGSTGKKYKSHYHTILSWERKNGDDKPQQSNDEDLESKYGSDN